jgi:glycosyltransferase involved in cell wall biosynthesis
MNRVLLLIKGLGRGGAEQLLLSAAPHLDRSRFLYEVAYLLPDHTALVAPLERAGLRVECLHGGRGAGWVARLRRLAYERRIDLVHAHSPYPAVGARSALPRRIHHVYTEHNVWPSYHRATYWGNALTFAQNHHVFAVAESVRASLRYPRPLSLLPMPPAEVLYHGSDLERVGAVRSDTLRQELGIPAEAPVVGTVANFRAEKGHRHLLEAAGRVRRAVPDVRFVLIGVGPLRGELERGAHDLGLDGTVVFAGHRSDAAAVADAFDVFALPSVYEGLSIALLEAMARGTACVVTDAGGLPEVIRNGREGLVVPAGDPTSLARGILAVLGDGALRDRLGKAGRCRAAAFDIRTTVRRTEEVYERVLSG